MAQYILLRLVRWMIGLTLVIFATYAMMFYGAGDPIKRMFIDSESFDSADEAVLQALQKQYGLDQPFLIQFRNYATNLLRGDWGKSIRLSANRPVWNIIKFRLPVSMQLGLAATLLAAVVGTTLGVIAALYHNKWLDRLVVSTVIFLTAIPAFVTAPLLLLFLVLTLKVMDVPYGWNGIFHKDVILPVIVISLGPLPIIVRQTRSAVLDVQSQLYIRTARAKGLSERKVVFKHMLRPVLTPLVTTLGLQMITLINGSLFVELVFNIPGFGLLTAEGIKTVDYPIIMAVAVIGTLIIFISNFFVDLVYPLLDPRLRYT